MYLPRRAAQRRSFVSTGLLSRTWDNHTVLELRREAKARGLSTKGNKSTLIARIHEHEQDGVNSTPSSKFLVVNLPKPSQTSPDAPVQVPYLPDFWNSARSKPVAPAEPELPKLHFVSGPDSHGLEKHPEEGSPAPSTKYHPPISKEVGFWPDFWDSVGLPRSFSVRRTVAQATSSAAQVERNESYIQPRPLTSEEKKGLFVLLGILGCSWLVGALVNRQTVFAEDHVTQPHR